MSCARVFNNEPQDAVDNNFHRGWPCCCSRTMLYTVRTLNVNKSSPFHRQSPDGGTTADRLSAAVSFDRPFEYSTSTWLEDGCKKNATKFHRLQRPSDGWSSGRAVDAVLRSAAVVDGRRSNASPPPFVYMLSSATNQPHLRFTIPGELSSFNQRNRKCPCCPLCNVNLPCIVASQSTTNIFYRDPPPVGEYIFNSLSRRDRYCEN